MTATIDSKYYQKITTAIWVIILLVVNYFQRFKLYTFESDHLFLFDADWITGHLCEVGGINLLITSFVTQFFKFPIIGTIVTTIIYATVIFCSNKLILSVTNTKNLNPLALLPVGFMVLCIEDPFYGYRGHTAMAVGMAAVILYQRVIQQKEKYEIAIALAFSVVLYALFGAVALLFDATILTIALLNKRKATAAIIATAATLLFSFAALVSEQFISMTEATLPTQYYNWPTPFRTMLFAWLAVPAILLLAKAENVIKAKLNIIDTAVLIVIIVAFGLGFNKLHNPKIAKMQHECYLADNNRWEDIAKLNKRAKTPTNIVSYTNLALAMKGQLLDRMFLFNQQLPTQRTDSRTVRNEIMRMESLVYFKSGHMAEARKAAFNSALITPDGVEPHDFTRLTAINKSFGADDISRKYAKVLSKTLFYRQEAANALADTNVTRLPKNSNFCEINGFAHDYQGITEVNKQNSVAQQFYIAYVLLSADKNRLLSYLNDHKNEPMHRRIEEACTLMFSTEECRDFGVSENVINDFGKLKKGQEINYFYESYWYYIAYLNTMLKK
ncbi:MAG: hypothetical protein J6U13_02075 [Salinivirgaceae bacterium]|nr:hypothetical protein [Salinivirgaceae bacterium]